MKSTSILQYLFYVFKLNKQTAMQLGVTEPQIVIPRLIKPRKLRYRQEGDKDGDCIEWLSLKRPYFVNTNQQAPYRGGIGLTTLKRRPSITAFDTVSQTRSSGNKLLFSFLFPAKVPGQK
jgi:hypothetical protein